MLATIIMFDGLYSGYFCDLLVF